MTHATVEVTDEKYRILKHQPTQAGFDANGRSLWPLDQFTHRMVAEGSIRIVKDDEQAGSADTTQADSDALDAATVSLMITQEQRGQLRARGFTDDQIAHMTPPEAHAELGINTAGTAGKEA